MQEKGPVKCPYCDKEFKRITSKHLEKHGVTYNKYLKEHHQVKYIENLLIKFFDEFYVTVRSKYLLYDLAGNTYTINTNKPIEKVDETTGEVIQHKPLVLCKKQLQKHLRLQETIGIFFPMIGTKIIGLDLDINDVTALERIYDVLVTYLKPTDFLMSSSGGKGFHIDIFLENILNRDIVIKFYELVLSETGLKPKQLELRGASEQGYKLPFGMHHKKKHHCGAVNQYGVNIEVDNIEELVLSRTKANINTIIDAVLINHEDAEETVIPESFGILTDDEIIEFEDMTSEITVLESYNNLNEDFIEDLSLIYRKGFDGAGLRNKYTFKIALFLKCHMRFKKNDVLEEMLEWKDRCKGYRALESEFETDIRATVDKIFKEDLKLLIAAKEIKISKVEIKEILSIKCRTSQETRALRLLYYMMFLHSKAYSDDNGVFFMTLQQMQSMGAVKRNPDLKKQIDKLISLNKIYKYPTKRVSRLRYAPTEYKLIALSELEIKIGVKTFNICDEEIKCTDCMDRATDFLITDRNERQKYRKGKCLDCPFNKR